jgi:hypothetical protein
MTAPLIDPLIPPRARTCGREHGKTARPATCLWPRCRRSRRSRMTWYMGPAVSILMLDTRWLVRPCVAALR